MGDSTSVHAAAWNWIINSFHNSFRIKFFFRENGVYRKKRERASNIRQRALKDSPSPFRVAWTITRYTRRGGRKREKSTSRQQRYAGRGRGRKKARHVQHKRARAWQCVSCRSACPRWRTRVYADIEKRYPKPPPPPEPRLYCTLMTSRETRTRESRYVLIVTHLLQPGCWRCVHTQDAIEDRPGVLCAISGIMRCSNGV